MNTNLVVELDDSVKNNSFFQKIKSIQISKSEIFKYGIHNLEVPEFIHEDEFEYLESKIPSFADLNEDWIQLTTEKIVNLGKSETATKISEIIGVGAGLLYATKLLSVNPNRIFKIPHPEKKRKILDFSLINNLGTYEIEAKGTTSISNINKFKKDIEDKKNDNQNSNTQIGLITLARKINDKDKSKLIVMDDYNYHPSKSEIDIIYFLNNYLWLLSFILDSSHYNRLIKKINKNKFKKRIIPKEKIFKKYVYKDHVFLGYYYDKRLILEKIKLHLASSSSVSSLFKKLTENVGIEKYFLGLDEKVIDFINNHNVSKLSEYEMDRKIIESGQNYMFLDNDGVLLVKSKDGKDKQIEKNFPDQEVKDRLGIEFDFIRNNPHKCGAPCRSKEIEGKPCEKLTFREYCHFHR